MAKEKLMTKPKCIRLTLLTLMRYFKVKSARQRIFQLRYNVSLLKNPTVAGHCGKGAEMLSIAASIDSERDNRLLKPVFQIDKLRLHSMTLNLIPLFPDYSG